MTRDCKNIHQIIRDRDSWQDGWPRAIASAWEIALSIVLVVAVALWVAV